MTRLKAKANYKFQSLLMADEKIDPITAGEEIQLELHPSLSYTYNVFKNVVRYCGIGTPPYYRLFQEGISEVSRSTRKSC